MRKCTRIGILILLILFCLALACAEALAAELTLPSGLKEIEAEVFMGDTSLDTVILPNGIEKIGAKAFANSSVKRIYLPATLSTIADDAFSGCTNLVGYGPAGTTASSFLAATRG